MDISGTDVIILARRPVVSSHQSETPFVQRDNHHQLPERQNEEEEGDGCAIIIKIIINNAIKIKLNCNYFPFVTQLSLPIPRFYLLTTIATHLLQG